MPEKSSLKKTPGSKRLPKKVYRKKDGSSSSLPKENSEVRTKYSGVYTQLLKSGDTRFIGRYKISGKSRKFLIGKVSEGMTEEKAASLRLEKIDQELNSAPTARKKSDFTLNDVFEIYLDDREIELGRRLKTERRLRWDYDRHFRGSIGLLSVTKINLDVVKEFRQYFQKNGYSYKTVYNHLSTLKTLLRLSVKRGFRSKIDFDFPMPTYAQSFVRTTERLTKEELVKFLDTLEAEKPQIRNLFLFVLHTGLRRSELCRMSWEDVDFKFKTLKINTPKSGKAFETIPLSDSAVCILEDQKNLKSRRRRDARVRDSVFFTVKGYSLKEGSSSFDHMFKRIRKNAGIGNDFRMLHGLRHHFGSVHASIGTPIPVLMKLMRHTSMKMTMRYVEILEEEEREAANLFDLYLKK